MIQFLIYVVVILIILEWLYKIRFDINQETGDLLMWFNYKGRRENIILIYKFKDINNE